MAQDPPTGATGNAMPSHGLVGQVPNMLPHNASMASAFGSLSFLPPTQELGLQHPLSNYASFAGISLRTPDQYTGFSTQAAPTRFFNMDLNQDGQAALNIRHKPAAMQQPMAPSMMPVQPRQKRSRLPSEDVGRKAPRESASSSPHEDNAAISSKTRPGQKPTRQNPRAAHGNGGSARQPQRKAPTKDLALMKRAALMAKNSQANIRRNNPSTPARARPIVADDEDYGEMLAEEKTPWPSSEADKSGEHVTPRSTRSAGHTRNGSSTFVTIPTRNISSPSVHTNRPRPKYDYRIPPQLEAIHRALGDNNWTEYLILSENRCLNNITEEEFVKGGKKIFATYDDATRRKMEKLVTNKVVLPVLQASNEEGRQQQQEVRRS